MPKLKSGRQVAVEAPDLAARLQTGTSEEIYGLVLLYRLNILRPADVIPFLSVVYFKEQSDPPGSPFRSGFLVRDILEGRADWTPEEIDELREWLDNNPQVNAAAAAEFALIDRTIKNSLIWDSELTTDKPECGTPH